MTIEQINNKRLPNSMLTAIDFDGFRILPSGFKSKLIKVKCDCGVIKTIEAYNLSRGKTRSCGCTRPLNCGHTSIYFPVIKRLQNIWLQMKERCDNPQNKAYKYYGGKGVAICNEWRSYQCFLNWAIANGYKNGLTIDRKDNALGYCPENCKWSTHKEQCNNRTSCIYVTHDGVTRTIQQWSEILNMSRGIVEYRLFKQGISIGDLLNSTIDV